MNRTRLRRSLALVVLLYSAPRLRTPGQRPRPLNRIPKAAPRRAQHRPRFRCTADTGGSAAADRVARVARRSRRAQRENVLDRQPSRPAGLPRQHQIEDVNYPTLLAILRANGMAATTIEGA